MTVKPEPPEPCSRARSRSIARMDIRAGSRGPPSPAQVRKTVTIVFADLAGSTALGERLDPEALRDLQTRYFAAMRRALERHGGTVEKYIGDAVMAVFGIPVLHEQDALRAVRAAVEMRDAMAELNRELEHDLGVGLELRVGINTGEVAGADGMADHGFVSGDAVNTAARLQAEAPPGGIVIGAQTRRLVESGVRLRPHGPVSVKGKRRPLRVWQVERLVDTRGRFMRGLAVPLVGRRAELRMLTTRFRRAVDRDSCVLATAVGPAGIGKSRLLREFAAGIEDEATVIVGRCLPYGEGITYWPLIEIVNDLAGVTGVPESRVSSPTTRRRRSWRPASRLRPAEAGRARPRRTCSGRCGGSSRRLPGGVRWSSCSMTSTGPSRPCST